MKGWRRGSEGRWDWAGGHRGSHLKHRKQKKFKYHQLCLFHSIRCRQPVVMMRDRDEIDADLGTFPPHGSLCLSGVSNWLPKRRGPVGSLGDECLAPVLLLRILILRRFDTTTSAADIERLEHICIITHCESQDNVWMYLHHPWTGRLGASSPGCGCWSSPEGWRSSQTESWTRPEVEGCKQSRSCGERK